MQNNMQIWLESSTTTFNLNSHDEGVYLVSDLDGLTSLPSIRTSQGVNAGTDGGWTSAQAFDARLIDVNIVIANEDVSIVESKRRTLNSLLAQSRKETLKLHFISEAGMEYVINVRVMNVSGALTNILKKQELLIQLRADDPIIYGAQTGEGADATLTVQQASGGFEIPFDIPLIISGGTDKTNVENLGSEDVYPVIKMTGPLHNPTVVNETQNAEIGVNADLGDMEWRGYEDFSLYGNTTQETLSGKNLANLPQNTSLPMSSHPITVLDFGEDKAIDGRFTLYLTNAKYTNNTAAVVDFIQDNGTHHYRTAVGFNLNDIYGNPMLPNTVLNGAYVTRISASEPFRKINLYLSDGYASWQQGTTNTQFELGTTATAYEPYCGGIPSPNPDFPQEVKTVTGAQTVKITGKNLLSPTQVVAYSNNAETYITSDDNWIRFKTGATPMLIPNPVKTQGAVTLTAIIKSGVATSNSFGLSAIYTDGTQTTIDAYGTSDTDEHTFTWTSDSAKTLDYLKTRNTWNKEMFLKIAGSQLELGTTATAYEPYQGQSYEINLGKNLFDTTLEQGSYSGTTGAKTSDNTIYRSADKIAVQPSTTYTLSLDGVSQKYVVLFYDGSEQYISQNASLTNGTFTTLANARYIAIRCFASDYTSDFANLKIQLEAGSKATSYSAYKTPMEFCKIGTYQDKPIKKNDGKWYKHAEIGKVVFDGVNEQVTSVSSNGSGVYYAVKTVLSDTYKISTTPISDRYIGGVPSIVKGRVYIATARNLVMCDIGDSLTTKELWNTWLSTHNTTVYYVLATPTDIEITDSELVGQLDALLDYAPWYGEDQNVFLIPSGGAQGTFIIGAPNDPKPADVVLIDTQMKTVTFNGQNIYNKLTEGSSFFTLAPGGNTMYLTSDVASDTGKAEIKFKQGFISI